MDNAFNTALMAAKKSPCAQGMVQVALADGETYQIKPGEFDIQVVTSGAGSSIIYLPPVAPSGQTINITLFTDGGDLVVASFADLTTRAEDDSGFADITMDTADDHIVLRSDGRIWHDIGAEHA